MIWTMFGRKPGKGSIHACSLYSRMLDVGKPYIQVKNCFFKGIVSNLRAKGPDSSHQPRGIVNTQIARQLRDFDVTLVADPGPVYPLLGTQSRPIQKAAFDILHRWIPSQQEQISVDVALSGDAASSLQLPPEILSLVIDTPEAPEEVDVEFANEIPPAVKGYLLSWILVFDHFENAVSVSVPPSHLPQLANQPTNCSHSR